MESKGSMCRVQTEAMRQVRVAALAPGSTTTYRGLGTYALTKELARKDNAANSARKIQKPRLAIINAHVVLANTIFEAAFRGIVNDNKRTLQLKLQAQSIVLGVAHDRFAHLKALV